MYEADIFHEETGPYINQTGKNQVIKGWEPVSILYPLQTDNTHRSAEKTLQRMQPTIQPWIAVV